MAGIRDHTGLDVYKLADELEQMVASIITRPEFGRDPDLRRQIKRASESPCPNIAEGFSRYHPRDNARFVNIAKSSMSELIVHMTRASRKQLVTADEAARVCALARRARAAAMGYIRYLQRAELAPATKGLRRRRKA